jgi:hypothetical protein
MPIQAMMTTLEFDSLQFLSKSEDRLDNTVGTLGCSHPTRTLNSLESSFLILVVVKSISYLSRPTWFTFLPKRMGGGVGLQGIRPLFNNLLYAGGC